MEIEPTLGVLEQKLANYEPGRGDKRLYWPRVCVNCMQYRRVGGVDARCALVQGEISAFGRCDYWTANTEEAGEALRAKSAWRQHQRNQSKQTIERLHNAYIGMSVVVLGTGPSLDRVKQKHLDALKNRYTIGVNTLALYKRLKFKPTLYCVSESTWLSGLSVPNLISALKEPGQEFRFYAHHWPLEGLDSWTFVQLNAGAHIAQGDFQGLGSDLEYVATGQSVVALAVQLACWLGFQEVYLLGVDATRSGHAKGVSAGIGDDERDPQNEFVQSMEKAQAVMKARGRELANLNPKGALTIPRRKLGDVL